MTVAIFCGSREWRNPVPIRDAMSKLPPDSVIIVGRQRGADEISEVIAGELGYGVDPVEAEWEAFGSDAGPIRNGQMLRHLLAARNLLKQPVCCYAFHDEIGLGSGTHNMVVQCMKARIRTYVWIGETPEALRVSHKCVCEECGCDYIHHPLLISELDYNGDPFLNWICCMRNGVAKL